MSSKSNHSGINNKNNSVLLVYPFGVDEEVLSEAASGLKELGGESLG